MFFPITRAQRVALKRIYDRAPLYKIVNRQRDLQWSNEDGWVGLSADIFSEAEHDRFSLPIGGYWADATYSDFRRAVQSTFGCDGAVTVQWCGMWLCIERDGYTHS